MVLCPCPQTCGCWLSVSSVLLSGRRYVFDGTCVTITLLRMCTLMGSARISITTVYSRKVVEPSVISITVKSQIVSTVLAHLKTFQNVDQKCTFPGEVLSRLKPRFLCKGIFLQKYSFVIFLPSIFNLHYLRTNLDRNYVKGPKDFPYNLLNLLLQTPSVRLLFFC